MTEPEARRVFANLMQKARKGHLSEHERLKLAIARQKLRRGRRPAMNPRKRRPSSGSYRPPQEFHGTTHRGYSIKFNALRNEYWIEKDGAFIAYAQTITEAKQKIDSIFGDNPKGRGLQRIGRAVEVRYHRTIGGSPGYYKHEIRSRSAGVYTIPPGWVYVGSKSILITEKPPRVR